MVYSGVAPTTEGLAVAILGRSEICNNDQPILRNGANSVLGTVLF